VTEINICHAILELMMNRRMFARWASALGLAQLFSPPTFADDVSPEKFTSSTHFNAMQRYADLMTGSKVTIGLLVYPGMFLQDLVGPLTVFESLMNRDIHFLWKDLDVIGGDKPEIPTLIPIKPTTTFQNCPETLDVLFVPGGVPGTFSMMEDQEVLTFLAAQGKTARFVTSVCTGSLILGAAGLLNGYKATSYWAVQDVLKEFGAIPTQGRVVVDRNRITGGGVTAGIDFGLTIASLLRGEDYAKAIQLYLEYDPAPPFNAGSPDKAPQIVRDFLNDMFVDLKKTAYTLAKKSKKTI
jgi:cyclohexyl-isocyanide hydratase